MTTTAYTSRVTNWPLFWGVNVLAVVLIASSVVPHAALAPMIIAAAALVLVNLMMTSLRTTVGPSGVMARFGVFGVPRFRYRADEIDEASVEDIPMYKLGGYGVHWSPWRGTRLTVRSGPSLRLRLTSGRRVVISVADPAAAVDVLTTSKAHLPG